MRVAVIFIASLVISLSIMFRVIGIEQANADMDWYDLKYDYDFKKAVEEIVEGCSVDDGYIYC